jgi:hypothetical protein
MTRARAELDADREKTLEPTEYKTEINRYPLPCGVCAKTFYVDEQTLRDFERKIERDPDNQFICTECDLAYEDMAHG